MLVFQSWIIDWLLKLTLLNGCYKDRDILKESLTQRWLECLVLQKSKVRFPLTSYELYNECKFQPIKKYLLRVSYSVYKEFRLNHGKRSAITIFGHFWPLSKRVVFFEAAGIVVKVCTRPESNHQIKLSWSKSLIFTVEMAVKSI